MLLHPDPRRIALVGLGAGVSLGAVQAYEIEQADCIEISREVAAASRLFGHVNGRWWQDPRTRLRIDDGRRFLALTGRRYDCISVDPVDPPVCNLYTQDFFQLCHDRLADGGLMVEWLPLFRLSREHLRVVMQAFVNVFPDTTVWYDGTSVLLIARRDGPLRIDLEMVIQRSGQARVVENLGLIDHPGPVLLLSTYVAGPQGVRRLIGSGVPQNTDDRPFLEYDVLRAGRLDRRALADNLEMLTAVFEPIDARWLPDSGTAESLEQLRQAAALMRAMLEVRIRSLRDDPAAPKLLEGLIDDFELSEADLRLLQPFLKS
jgi:spermidine synthase